MRNIIFVIVTMNLFGCSMLDFAVTAIQSDIAGTTTPVTGIDLEGVDGRRIRISYSSLPEFVETINVNANDIFFPEAMCVTVDYLWQGVHPTVPLNDHYSSTDNFTLSLDDVDDLPSDLIYLEDALFELHLPPGGKGNSFATLNYCFSTTDLSVGHHIASITLISPEGDPYAYTWDFEIVDGS